MIFIMLKAVINWKLIPNIIFAAVKVYSIEYGFLSPTCHWQVTCSRCALLCDWLQFPCDLQRINSIKKWVREWKCLRRMCTVKEQVITIKGEVNKCNKHVLWYDMIVMRVKSLLNIIHLYSYENKKFWRGKCRSKFPFKNLVPENVYSTKWILFLSSMWKPQMTHTLQIMNHLILVSFLMFYIIIVLFTF